MNKDFFQKLKTIASHKKTELPILWQFPESEHTHEYILKPYGAKGYEWIIYNNEYSLLIGNWDTPQSKPGLLITIKSETLWRLGVEKAVSYILNFIMKISLFSLFLLYILIVHFCLCSSPPKSNTTHCFSLTLFLFTAMLEKQVLLMNPTEGKLIKHSPEL